MRVAVIPARWGSMRFPGKPLVEVFGVPMIERVVRRVEEAGVFDEVWVATDHGGIAERVAAMGGRAVMTAEDHPNGTSRVWEAVCRMEQGAGLPPVTAVVNVQGDEPFVRAEQLRMLVDLIERPTAAVATLARPMAAGDPAFTDPNRVKVVTDLSGRALYFSRSPIPSGPGDWLKHVGLYAFTRDALARIATLPPCELEERERLEQLRWLAHGLPIQVGHTPFETPCIDTPDDLKKLHAGPPPP